MKSVDKRHDCVHRNGVDKEGNTHDDLTDDYLQKLGDIFSDMADALDNAIRDKKVKRFFENLDDDDDVDPFSQS